MLNNQPIEKPCKGHYDGTLDVHSIFPTIQGEGPFSGRAATFIRLAGCNLQCPWCDTEYTKGRRRKETEAIFNEAASITKPGGLIVITGGEPFRQSIGHLIHVLTVAGFPVQVETNGTLPPPEGYDWLFMRERSTPAYIVCSPKTGKVNPRIAKSACCYKYVLDADSIDEDDGLPVTALGHSANPRLARPPKGMAVYIQPADHKDEDSNAANIAATVKSAKEYGYILQLQIHKYLGVE